LPPDLHFAHAARAAVDAVDGLMGTLELVGITWSKTLSH
jgi:hypothetical protein